MAKHIAAIIIMSALLCLTTVATAQDGIISEADFWYRLELTGALLDGSSAETITQVNDLWRNVDSVRLPDETVIRVDVNWLKLSPRSSAAERAQVNARVQAILTFHERYPGDNARSADNLAKLNNVFRYEAPQSSSDRVSSGDSDTSREFLSPSLSQTILIVAGVIVAIGLLVYLWRMLQVQPAAVDLDSDTILGSSQAATDKAEELKAINDYRAAIRQLYLASLLVLDEQRVIRYDAALTNREHLEQLREQPLVRELMTQVVTIFDRVWYGFAPADETLYHSFRQYLEQLRRFGR